ncbi:MULTISPECIES: glycosyltransferase [Nocardiaceae]|uniref:Glycosyltransferase involved in cell wall biosynthesis n=1 Tax=Rhodococcoides corynebacterioides TaxID=53972 RepID=A0ABS2KZ93_9NOCA|nr:MULTISPECIES: glycosyltransferase [Rhodococcus]MBM7417254.1 glycosyltransferase involved in cell wall biosynthesis [Rhodococcus corynebacterioides]MBP1115507.1 glycosyltransferase involved in cell wall biosynthesis [Rhodococcus sp. PvP016]
MARHVAILGTRGYPSYYGGFETLVRTLAPYLADTGWDVSVYSRPGATVDDDPARDMRIQSVVSRGVDTQSLSTLSFGATSALSTVRRRPDVALIMNVANGFWLPFLRAARIPTVVNVDGIEWEREKWGANARRAFRLGAKLTATHATSLIFDSVGIADRWQTGFGRDGTTIAYGGTVPGMLDVPLGLTSGKYALLVSRFVPENTVDEFLEAASVIAEKHDVVLVGSSGYGGELDAKAEKLAAENTRVRWLGHVHDDQQLFALWRHAGAYFHGHSVGGTNPALVQAMACGAPTVARDTVFNREVLGDNAVFVPPTAPEIAAAVTALLEAPTVQHRLGAGAEERARHHYSWDSICEQYDTLLRRHLPQEISGPRISAVGSGTTPRSSTVRTHVTADRPASGVPTATAL